MTTPLASVSTTNAAAVMLMSSSRRLLTLYESIRRVAPIGASLRGKTTHRTTSSAAITDLR